MTRFKVDVSRLQLPEKIAKARQILEALATVFSMVRLRAAVPLSPHRTAQAIPPLRGAFMPALSRYKTFGGRESSEDTLCFRWS